MLESSSEFGWEARHPGGVNEADAEQVRQVDLVFSAVRRQFHPHERLQCDDAEHWVRAFVIFHGGRRSEIVRTDPLARRQDVYRVAGLRIGSVEEHVDARDVPSDEAHGLKRALGHIQVMPAHQNADVLRVPHGSRIDLGDPGGNRIAADHRVRHARGFQRRSGAEESFAYQFHGKHHPVEHGQVFETVHDVRIARSAAG